MAAICQLFGGLFDALTPLITPDLLLDTRALTLARLLTAGHTKKVRYVDDESAEFLIGDRDAMRAGFDALERNFSNTTLFTKPSSREHAMLKLARASLESCCSPVLELAIPMLQKAEDLEMCLGIPGTQNRFGALGVLVYSNKGTVSTTLERYQKAFDLLAVNGLTLSPRPLADRQSEIVDLARLAAAHWYLPVEKLQHLLKHGLQEALDGSDAESASIDAQLTPEFRERWTDIRRSHAARIAVEAALAAGEEPRGSALDGAVGISA